MVHPRPRLTLATLVLAAAACSAEDAVRERLAEDGYFDIELEPADDGAFAFRARKSDLACTGKISHQSSFTAVATSIDSRCGPAPVAESPPPAPPPAAPEGLGRPVDYPAET